MTAAATQRTSAESSELRPVTTLRGVGESLAEKLAKLGITTVQDLLFLLPLRYEDRTRVVPIGSLRVGERAVIEGEVLLSEVAFRGRRQLLCRIGDGSGSLTLRFFHFSRLAAAGARARHAPALLRRDSPRARRSRDRASRVSARRRREPARRKKRSRRSIR